MGEDVVASCFVVDWPSALTGGRWGGGIAKFLILVINCAFGAGKDFLLALVRFPEVGEMLVHFFEEVAVVCGGVGVDHIVDTVLRDDKSVAETLTLGAFVVGGERILAAVVRCKITYDVGKPGFREDEFAGVVGGVFLSKVS